MDQLPDHPTPQPAPRPRVRVIHVSVQPTTWFGKVAAGIFGGAVMLAAFFLSLVVFAIIAGIAVAALVYLLWATRRARRAMRDQTIDGEVRDRAVH